MNSKFLTLTAVTVALGAGTYLALNKIAPQRQVEKAAAQQGPTADEVFGGELNLAAVEEAAAAPAPVENENGEPVAAPVPGSEDAVVGDLPGEEPEAAALAGDAGSEAPEEPEPATLEPTAEAAASTPPPSAPVAAEPPPAAAPVPAANVSSAEESDASASTSAAPAAEPAPVAKPQPPKPKATVRKTPPKAEPAVAWWGAESGNGLAVTYAGSAAFRKALVLMFNGDFGSADAVNASVKVLDASGKPVSGSWEVNAKNPRMLIFPVDKSGRYTVVVGAGLQDAKNRSLETSVQGPVRVQ